jgi:hypothetical protein
MNKTDVTFIIAISAYLILVGFLMFEIGSRTEGLFEHVNGVLNTLDWLIKYSLNDNGILP